MCYSHITDGGCLLTSGSSCGTQCKNTNKLGLYADVLARINNNGVPISYNVKVPFDVGIGFFRVTTSITYASS